MPSEAPLASLEPPAVQGLRFSRESLWPWGCDCLSFVKWSEGEASLTPMTDSDSCFLVNGAKLALTQSKTNMHADSLYENVV